MILSEKQQTILEALARTVFPNRLTKIWSLQEIAAICGVQSKCNPSLWVFEGLQELKKKGLVNKKKRGFIPDRRPFLDTIDCIE